jgi:hypothetical protein
MIEQGGVSRGCLRGSGKAGSRFSGAALLQTAETKPTCLFAKERREKFSIGLFGGADSL